MNVVKICLHVYTQEMFFETQCCDVAELTIVHKENLAKFGNTQDMKINNPSILIYRNLAMYMI